MKKVSSHTTFCKLFIFGFLLCIILMTACASESHKQLYSRAWGCVKNNQSSMVTVNTSGGFAITSPNFPTTLTPGDCMLLSFEVDETQAGGTYPAYNVDYTLLNRYTPQSGSAPTPNDSVVLSAVSISSYSPSDFYGNNYLLSISASTYEGLEIAPEFYYDNTKLTNSFSAQTDSIIIDVRLQISGSSTDTIAYNVSGVCTVDLTNIRTALTSLGTVRDATIPVFFRYIPGTNTTAYSNRALMTID